MAVLIRFRFLIGNEFIWRVAIANEKKIAQNQDDEMTTTKNVLVFASCCFFLVTSWRITVAAAEIPITACRLLLYATIL